MPFPLSDFRQSCSTVKFSAMRLFTDDNDVIGSKANHVTGSAQVEGLERWNSYENFSGLSTSLTALTVDGGECRSCSLSHNYVQLCYSVC